MTQKQSFVTGSSLNKKSAHKSHKVLWISLSILIVLLFIPVLVAGWLGFIPGLSNMMGSASPRDLGVRYSQADVSSYKQKTAIAFKDYSLAPADPKNPTEKSVLSTPRTVNGMKLSQEEVTAALNSTGYNWVPIEHTQVRLTDGVVELSGDLNLDKLENLRQHLAESGYDNPDATNALNWARRLTNHAPVYAKATASIQNNVLSFRLLEAQIGRLDIPLGSFGQDVKNSTTKTPINSDIFQAQSARLTRGNLVYTGTYPSIIYLEK